MAVSPAELLGLRVLTLEQRPRAMGTIGVPLEPGGIESGRALDGYPRSRVDAGILRTVATTRSIRSGPVITRAVAISCHGRSRGPTALRIPPRDGVHTSYSGTGPILKHL